MKLFETPDIKVVNFCVEDVITTSTGASEETTMPSFAGAACMS